LDELLDCCKTAAYVEVLQRDIVQRQTRLELEDFAQIQVRVIEPFKGDIVAGQTLTFLEQLYENDADSAPATEANPADDDLQPSRRYVVFLNWNDALASRVAYNREAMFRVTDDRIQPLGRSPFAKSQRNQSWRSFEAAIREHLARKVRSERVSATFREATPSSSSRTGGRRDPTRRSSTSTSSAGTA
jgi:hypothetical protein